MTIPELLSTLPHGGAAFDSLTQVECHIGQTVGSAPYVLSGHVTQESSSTFRDFLARDALRILMPHCVYEAQVTRLMHVSGDDSVTRSEPPPTLDHLVKTVLKRIDGSVRNWQDGIARYMAWRSDAFGKTPKQITTQVFDGETHNGGQFLFRISDDCGCDVVYKPVSLKTSSVVVSIISSLIAPNLPDEMCVADIYPIGKDYGFIGFLPTDNRARSEEDVQRFFRVLGAWVAISHCLRMPDMHFENILISNCLPTVVDLETAFFRTFYIGREDWDMLTSGFLSLGYAAGVFGGGRVREITTHVRQQSGGRMMMSYAQDTTKDASRLYFHDKWATPVDNIDSLKKGFAACFTVIMEHRNDILSLLAAESRAEPILVRCVFRYTWDYVVMGQWYTQPSLNGENKDKVLERCRWNDVERVPMLEQVATCEFSDIANGDVPYFYSNYSDHHLYHGTGCVYADHFDMTGAEMMTRHFEQLAGIGLKRYLHDLDTWAQDASALMPKLTLKDAEKHG